MYVKYFKRIIDLLFSSILLLSLSPFLIIVVIILSCSNKGNPFFFQTRIGKHDKKFRIWKFKTMADKKDLNGNLLPDNLRVTSLGSIIRKASIDEFPQLFNVIKGDMSLIGPRPLLVEYLPLYSEFQRKRHNIRPGITGWAQINGRNAISWEKKFEFDVWYVDNVNIFLDLRILLLTIRKVFLSENINQGMYLPMEKFKGNN
jgi:undecaprenyl phosphate N,N'-diacetylbacillosamine 1-phosphate transferase